MPPVGLEDLTGDEFLAKTESSSCPKEPLLETQSLIGLLS